MSTKLKEELKRYERRERLKELQGFPLPGKAVTEILGEKTEKIHWFLARGGTFDDVTPSQIVIKSMSTEEYKETFQFSTWPPKMWLRLYPPPFHPLPLEPKEEIILGAYQESLDLVKEDFEDQWLQLKTEFKITSDERKNLEAEIRELIEYRHLPVEIREKMKENLKGRLRL